MKTVGEVEKRRLTWMGVLGGLLLATGFFMFVVPIPWMAQVQSFAAVWAMGRMMYWRGYSAHQIARNKWDNGGGRR